MKYGGMVARQELVNFCRSRLPEIERRNNQLLDALHYAEQQKNVLTIHALEQGLMENYGAVKALREVCEWAREHMVEEKAIDEVDYDLDSLKARFNGEA